MGAKRKYTDHDIESAVRRLFLHSGGMEGVTANKVRDELRGGDRQRIKEILDRMAIERAITRPDDINMPAESQAVLEDTLTKTGDALKAAVQQVSNEKAAHVTAQLREENEELENKLRRQSEMHIEAANAAKRVIEHLQERVAEGGSINRELECRANDAERSASDLQKQLSKKDARIARLERHRTASKTETRTLMAALKTTRSARAA